MGASSEPGVAAGEGGRRAEEVLGAGQPAGARATGGPEVPRAAEPPPAAPSHLARALAQVTPAVEALWRSGRPALALDFGRALGLEIRSEGGAVALALTAPPDLLAAVRAAVPGLVAAAAIRGIPVVRAEVRQRGGGWSRT